MSSTSETGHAKNLATFKTIVNFCQGYGAVYNPATEQIKLDNLLIQLAAAEQAHTDCIKKQTTFNNATDMRMKHFAELGAKATRIMNAILASGAGENTIKSARSIMNKLQGKRVGKINENPDPSQTPAQTSSVSQRSYDKQLEHLSALLELVESITSYQPNETELQKASLSAYKTQLSDTNNLVMQSYTDWSNARIARYTQFYAKTTGFADTANLIKAYIKSIFGATSQQYKQLSPLQFSHPKQ